jgi:hypothetical protein
MEGAADVMISPAANAEQSEQGGAFQSRTISGDHIQNRVYIFDGFACLLVVLDVQLDMMASAMFIMLRLLFSACVFHPTTFLLKKSVNPYSC